MATAELIEDELRSALSEPIGAEEDDQGTSVSPSGSAPPWSLVL